MPKPATFQQHTALAQGLREFFIQLEARLGLSQSVRVYLATTLALH